LTMCVGMNWLLNMPMLCRACFSLFIFSLLATAGMILRV
jgi:hypothetical protein